MSEDSDLKRMFDAQRKIDEGLAPAFDEIHAKSLASRDASPVKSARKSPSLAIAMVSTAIVLLIVIGFFSWRNIRNIPQPDEPHVASPPQTDLQKLSHACDSLLATIRQMDSAAITQLTQESGQEMEWPTGTDSLIPFATLTMNTRNSR